MDIEFIKERIKEVDANVLKANYLIAYCERERRQLLAELQMRCTHDGTILMCVHDHDDGEVPTIMCSECGFEGDIEDEKINKILLSELARFVTYDYMIVVKNKINGLGPVDMPFPSELDINSCLF